MAKMPKTLASWLIPRLRRISTYWPGKQAAMDRSKRQVQIGHYKNGKPEYRVKFACAKCSELYDKSEIQMDHIIPMVNVSGFKTWDETLANLFCEPEGFQTLCKSCHYLKTQLENEERGKNRKKKL
jgi:5-methylcytosine-specific restriction endonuclease McrA